jgi:hypothetical protein
MDNTGAIWEAAMTQNLVFVGLITKIAYFSVTVAALTFVLMLLLTTLHP